MDDEPHKVRWGCGALLAVLLLAALYIGAFIARSRVVAIPSGPSQGNIEYRIFRSRAEWYLFWPLARAEMALAGRWPTYDLPLPSPR
jgi:hypothetical protein